MLKGLFSQRVALRQNRPRMGLGLGSSSGGSAGAAWAAGLLWLVAGLCAGYWALQAGGQGPWVPMRGLAPSAPQADVVSVARALGSLPNAMTASADAAPQPPDRLRLLGVVVQGRVIGAALIAVGDQPPRPWRVGAEVADGLVLQSVNGQGARLGESRTGPTTLELEMPKQQPPVSSGAQPPE